MVVVLVDTLRADRLSLYGYERETSPRLDRFARERGVVFTDAWANAGCTFPSVNSLFTGLWPQRFVAALDRNGMAIPSSTPTLAERFAARGWTTAAVSASSIVRRSPSKINRQGGFDRGFGSFDESCLTRPGSCVNARALDLLDALAEPYFLYVHYFDPHAPYRPPRGTPRRFSAASRVEASAWARGGDPAPIQHAIYGGDLAREFDAADVRHLSDLYDDEVRFADERFGELVAELERRGQLDRTLIAFVADHGEELYDNQGWAHCRDLAFESVLATPFVLVVPGFAPARRDAPVTNLDLAPTLLDLAGIPFDAAALDGRSLRAVLEGKPASGAAPFRFAAQGATRAATDGTRMMLLDLRGAAATLFPLRRAGAGVPLDPAHAEVVRLREALLEWVRAQEGGEAGDAVRRADELERELRAVGYL